jgi:hypothetical protein
VRIAFSASDIVPGAHPRSWLATKSKCGTATDREVTSTRTGAVDGGSRSIESALEPSSFSDCIPLDSSNRPIRPDGRTDCLVLAIFPIFHLQAHALHVLMSEILEINGGNVRADNSRSFAWSYLR